MLEHISSIKSCSVLKRAALASDLVEDFEHHVQAKQHAAAHERELHCIILCHCVLCLIARVSFVPES
jgi:hypothetical protein